MKNPRLLFVGGGTVGHINPLLAVMQVLQDADYEADYFYIGLAKDLQSSVIKDSPLHFQSFSIQSGKLNRFFTLKHLGQLGRLAQGFWQADRLLARIKPDLVFAKGGFVSVPVVWAAARRRIPIVCHESDVIPGLANRWIAKKAVRIFTAYPVEAYQQLPKERLCYSGQPVRQSFYQKFELNRLDIAGRELVFGDRPVLVALGGSQGARSVNNFLAQIWPQLLNRCVLVQQTGAVNLESMQAAAVRLDAQQRENLYLSAFLGEELAPLLQHCTLVVSRAGGTVAELAAVGKPAILIPLSTAAQNHQMANAEVLAKQGAALILDETTAAGPELLALIEKLLADNDLRAQMGEAIHQFDRPEAAASMAKVIKEIVSHD